MPYLFGNGYSATLSRKQVEEIDIKVEENKKIVCQIAIKFVKRMNKGRKNFLVGISIKLIGSNFGIETCCQAIAMPIYINNINKIQPAYDFTSVDSKIGINTYINDYIQNYEFPDAGYEPTTTIRINYSDFNFIKNSQKVMLNLRGGDLQLIKIFLTLCTEITKVVGALIEIKSFTRRQQFSTQQNCFNKDNSYNEKVLSEKEISELMRKQPAELDLKLAYQRVLKKQQELQELGLETIDLDYDCFKELCAEKGLTTKGSINEALSAVQGELEGYYKNTRRPIDYGLGILSLDFEIYGINEWKGVTHMDVKRPVSRATLIEQRQKISMFEQGIMVGTRISEQKIFWTDPNISDRLKHLKPEAKASLPKKVEQIGTVVDLCGIEDQTDKNIIKSSIYKGLLFDDNNILFINDYK